MATEADIPDPICETRIEQGFHIAEQSTSILNNKLPHVEKNPADTLNEPLTVEGEHFLTTPSIDQVHCEVNKTSPGAIEKPDQTEIDETVILLPRSPKLDDQPLEIAENAEDFSERIQQNAEQSNVSDKDEDRGVAPVECSGAKAGDVLPCADLDDVRVKTELSKDTTHGETTEEDISGNVTSDESKEGVGLSNERNFAGSLEIAAEKPSQENSTYVETITRSTSGDELQGKNTLNSSFCEEEDISIPKGVTTPEDSESLLEKTVNASHGDVEKQSKTLEDTITSQGNPKVTETEESPLVQVDGTQTEHDEQFEKGKEELSLAKVSTEGTDDNESTVIDKVIDDKEEEDLEKAELFETEENMSTLIKEDVDTEKSVESLHVVPEIIKASNLSEENKTSSPKEHSTNANQHEITSDDTEEKTIDAVEEKKEVLESFSTVVSSSSKEESVTAESECADEKTVDKVDTQKEILQSECTDEKTVDKVDTQKEILEDFSTVVPNEEIEENSNKVEHSETKDEETLEKESEEMSLPLRVEDGELRKTELCENESSESILLKVEPKIEKPEDSLIIVSGDIKESDLDHEIETRSYIEEQTEAAQPQADLDDKTDDRTLDAAETEEEILENVPTIVSDEKTEGDSLIQVDSTNMKNEDPLEKDSKEASLITDSTGNSNDDLITTMDEVKIEVEHPSRAELFQDEKNIEHGLSQHTETTASLKEQSLAESPEEISGDKTEEMTVNAGDSNEKTQEKQSVAINVSNEDNDENSLIQVDASQMKHDRDLEKEIETPSLEEASTKDAPEYKEITLLKKGHSQDGFQDIKTSVPNEDTEITCTFEERSLTAIPQAITSDKAIDSTGTKAVYLEIQNVATEVPHEHHAEEKDCSQMESEAPTEETNDDESKILNEPEDGDRVLEAELLENEKYSPSTSVMEEAQAEKHNDYREAASEDIMGSDLCQDTKLSSIDAAETKEETLQDIATNITDGDNEDKSLTEEYGSEKPSLNEASTEKTNDYESTVLHEVKVVDESSIRADLFENEKNTEDTLVKEEVSTESLQETSTPNLQEISRDEVEKKSIDAAETKEENLQVHLENSLNQVDCSQLEQVEHLVKNSESTSLTEALIGDTTESTLFKDEVDVEKPVNSLKVAKEDIRETASGQDTETNSIEEQILNEDPQEISCDETEEKSVVAAYAKEESLEDTATNVPNGENEDNSPIEVDCPQRPSLNEDFTGNNDEESTTIHEAKLVDQNLKAEMTENEKITESNLADDEVSSRSLEVSDEDSKASASGQDREAGSLEEQVLTINPSGVIDDQKEDKSADATETPEDKKVATTTLQEDTEKKSENTSPTGDATESTLKEDAVVEEAIDSFEVVKEDIEASEQIPTAGPQEISCDKTEEETIDDQKEDKSVDVTETPEDKKVATTILHEDTETNALIQVDCQTEQKEQLEKESENTSPIEDTEGSTLNDDAVVEKTIDSFEVVTEDSEACASDHCIEEKTSTTDPQTISCDKTEEKTIDDQEEDKPIDAAETPEDKNVATTTLQEDTEKNMAIQVSCQVEQNEHLEKESVNTSPTGDTIGSTLKDDADIEASDQIPTASTQEISCDRAEDKTIDPTYTEEKTLEDIATHVPSGHDEYSSPIEEDGSQKSSWEEASRENANEEDSSISYDAKFVDESSTKADLFENDKNVEGTLLKEEAFVETIQAPAEDIKEPASGQDTETSSLSVQCQPILPEEIMDNNQEVQTIDTTDLKEETPEHEAKVIMNISPAIPCEESEDMPLIQVHSSKMEQIEHSENEGESSSLTEAPTRDTTESALLKEAHMEKPVDIFQVANEDVKESTSIQETETSSIKEKTLTADAQETLSDKITEETTDATDKETFDEEKGSSSSVVIDVSKDMVVDIAEDPNCKQEDSSITEVSEENKMVSNENVTNLTSLASEASHLNSDYEVVREANSCGDRTDTENMGVQADGSIIIPTEENLIETDREESTEASLENAEQMQLDPEAITGEKYIQEELLMNVSQDVSESDEVNGEEERNSKDCKVISDSSNAVASEEDLTTNSSEENKREIHHEAETEEAQKQDEDLHVSALGQDSSMEEMEKDAQLSLSSADDSDVTEEVQKLEEPSLPAPGDNITEKTDSKKSEVPEDATKGEYIEHLEQENTTISFLDDKKPTAIEQGETECGQVLSDETVEEINEAVSIPVADDSPPKSFAESSEVDHSTSERELTIDREELQTGNTTTGDDEEAKIDNDKSEEEEAGKQKIPDFSSAATDMIEATDQDVARSLSEAPEENFTCKSTKEGDTFLDTTETTESTVINKGSITNIETKADNEAPETIKTAPTVTEGQEVESRSVQEAPALVSQLEKGEHEYTFIGNVMVIDEKSEYVTGVAPEEKKSEFESKNQVPGEHEYAFIGDVIVIDEKSESNVIGVAPEEKKSEYESKNEVLESIAQVQSCDIIPKATETKIEEENTETAAEIKSEDVMAEDIFEPKRTPYEKECMKVDISSEKFKEEDEHLEDYRGNCKEEVITERCLNDEVKQEEINTEEIFGVMNNGNETEKVSEVSEKTDDKAVEEPETNSLANESLDSQKELGKSNEETISDTDEVKSSTIAVEVKTAQEDGPLNLQNARDISEDVQELNEGCVEVSNKENPKEVDRNENIEAKVSSEEQEAENIQKAVVPETLNQETEEQQRGSTFEVVLKAEEENCEEDNIIDNKCNDLIENSSSRAAEKVSEFNVHQSSMEDIAQSDKKEETERQIDSLPILPEVKSSDIEAAERNLLMHTDVTELEVSPLPSNDKHLVLEADRTKNTNTENSSGNKNISAIQHGDSAERFAGELEILQPSKREPEEAHSGHERMCEETTESRKESESKEMDNHSLLDLLQASTKKTTEVACHSAIGEDTTIHKEETQPERTDEAEHEDAKSDEEKDDEDESSEQRGSELGCEAPVMVDMGDADLKTAHKKSHNILSGVGSKVKHSIAKVKKAITGKSSHPKPPSPK